MLKSMRKNLKSLAPVLWGVIIAFIISIFAVWGGAGRLGESRNSNTIATIGNKKISADTYIQNLRQRLEMFKEDYKELDANFIQQLNIPQQVLEQIIQRTILSQKAEELGIRASDEEISEKVKSFPVFQKEGKFVGFEEYKQILDWNRISASEFEASLINDIIVQKTILVLTAGTTVSEEELFENYKKTTESAQLEYILLENSKMELMEEPGSIELRKFFAENQEKYEMPEKRTADYLFFKTEELKEDINLIDTEIEKYYKDNLSQFTEPDKIKASRIFLPYESKEKELVRAEAQNILDKINQGEAFGKLAQSNSKDEKAEENGDWGLYEWKRLSQQEQDKIKSLAQGEVSGLLELEGGISIIKTTQKQPAVQKPLTEVKNQVTEILKDQKAINLADQQIAELGKKAQKENNLDVAAQKLGYKIRSTGALKAGDPIEDIDPSGTLSRNLFQLKDKESFARINTIEGMGLAQLQKTEPARPAEYEEVQSRVLEDFNLKKKESIALEKAKSIKNELKRQDFEKIAEKYELEYKTVEEHQREQYLSVIGENPEVDKLAFSLPLNEISNPINYNDGYIILHVLDRKEVSQDDFENNRSETRKNLLEVKKNKFFQSYYLQLREKIGVKTNYELFTKINSEVLARF